MEKEVYYAIGEQDLKSPRETGCLHIDSTPWDWQPYPVLRIDLNTNRYLEPGLLDGVLDDFVHEWADRRTKRHKHKSHKRLTNNKIII